MATKYFNSTATGHGVAGKWDDANNWWTSTAFTTKTSIPTSSDTVYLCDSVTNTTISPTVATCYVGTTSPNYQGAITSGIDTGGSFTFTNLYIPNGYISSNSHITVTSATVVQGTSYIEGEFAQTGGTVDFYDTSALGGPDLGGYLDPGDNVVVNFHNNSQCGNSSGGNAGLINADYTTQNIIVNFYNSSFLGQNAGDTCVIYCGTSGAVNFYNNSSSGVFGQIEGNANFYDSAVNYGAGGEGIVHGNLVYHYARPVSGLITEIKNAAGATSATIPVSGGGGGLSYSHVLLLELLKLPFPIVF
jgi:hypothetical protein